MQAILFFLIPPGSVMLSAPLSFAMGAQHHMAGVGTLDMAIVVICLTLTGIMLITAPGDIKLFSTRLRWQAMLRGAYQSGLRLGGDLLPLLQGVTFGLAATALILVLRLIG
ncbi:MAG: hypothetical protein P8O10_01285 [Pseudorhodobacter sp.]|nr:hypothetical protein [Pseudorhodobacter sp.]